MSRRICLILIALCAGGGRAEAQTLTFTPSPAAATSTTLWITVATRTGGTVGVSVRDNESTLFTAASLFSFETTEEQTKTVKLSRPIITGSPVTVQLSPKPSGPSQPGMIRSAGASLRPYKRLSSGVMQETALDAVITEPVECNRMVCVMCYTLSEQADVASDSLVWPDRTTANDDFDVGKNKQPGRPQSARWNQDDDHGQPVRPGKYFILLETRNSAGTMKHETNAFSVPGDPVVPSPGGRCQ